MKLKRVEWISFVFTPTVETVWSGSKFFLSRLERGYLKSVDCIWVIVTLTEKRQSEPLAPPLKTTFSRKSIWLWIEFFEFVWLNFATTHGKSFMWNSQFEIIWTLVWLDNSLEVDDDVGT